MRKTVCVSLLSVVSAAVLLGISSAHNLVAQSQKPLTAADLAQMKSMGFDDQTIVNAIGADGVSLDTSVQGLGSLRQAGLSDAVIRAAVAAAAKKSASAATSSGESGLPDEIGAYAQIQDKLTPLPVEVVNFKTAGTLGTAFSYGLKKTKIEGTVPGEKSATRLALPATIVLRCADGSAPTEYQLIQLEAKKGTRQFIESKIGVTGAAAGVDNQAVTLNFERIGHNTYKATVASLKLGEYGFLAPGAVVSTNTVSSGKLYSFGLSE